MMRYFTVILLLFGLNTGWCQMQTLDFDFKKLVRPDKPNTYLVCPKDYCSAPVDEIAKTYPMSAQALDKTWQAMIAKQPRTKLMASDPQKLAYQYVQYSRFFHFPDHINVIFIPLTEHTSTLAIYSRSVYGHYDFHVNEKRVKSWLSQLAEGNL